MSTMTLLGWILLGGAALSVAYVLGIVTGISLEIRHNENDDPSFLDTDS